MARFHETWIQPYDKNCWDIGSLWKYGRSWLRYPKAGRRPFELSERQELDEWPQKNAKWKVSETGCIDAQIAAQNSLTIKVIEKMTKY